MTEPSDLGHAAHGLIDQLRDFALELGPDERRLLAALLAPGIDAAWGESAEVSGFSADWTPNALSMHLGDAIRDRNLHVEGW